MILCLAAGRMQAYDFMSGGIAYKILSNTNTSRRVAVTYVTTEPGAPGYVTTYKGDVTIPTMASQGMQTFNVTQITDLAMFNNQGLYTLTMPEGIVSIGNQAFSHCYSLYKVNIPSTVSRLGNYAFEYCEDLKTVNLPFRLSAMGDGVFQQCFGLEAINVDEACQSFKSIDGVLYSNITSEIGMTLLAYPGARKDPRYVMPDNVARIDEYAFSANRGMTEITLSPIVGGLDGWTFVECEGIEAVYVANECVNYCSDSGVLLSGDGATVVYYPIRRPDTCYELPAGATAIGTLAFYCARTIRKLELPATLSAIGELAFYGCQSITEVTCKATTPPKWSNSSVVPGANLFDDTVYKSATLYVPAAALKAYQEANGWNRFLNIRPIGYNGIDHIDTATEEAPPEFFDLQGRPMASPAGGITIVRRGNTVAKVTGK